ncbi:protocadherin gamma-C4-like isoform X9 [Phalacrocorax aristotelis]|uniref:protocadherin gamma-C4-like isoform X9 n=1 Tax=Phalacrocorax aristotelis TaxID=126867 RepID=UPI003F4BB547
MLGGRSLPWQLPLLLAALSCLPAPSSAQLHYSVPEDREPGSSVGDLAKDLGLEVWSLAARNLRLVSEGGQWHFQVNLASGVLLLDSRLDREALCRQSPTCSLHLQLVMENPLQLHRIEVDILDVNDNAPQFPKLEVVLEITEVANPGTRLPLEVAEDPDMGSNSISTYELSPSEHFALSINVRGDGVKMPEIVLEKALDREKVAVHHLTLTALDGGNPVKSGTAKVTIHVLDANDNPPVCDPPVSTVHLEENMPVGTLVTKLNVTDLDEGPNGIVEYSFKTSNNAPSKFTNLFSLDARTGEIRTKGPLDYEESSAYEIAVRARDKGSPAMEGHCHLRVEIIDVNDNSPEIVLTSLSSPVQEDAIPGTVIALIGVKDSDSDDNGQVHLQIAKELPFKLVSSFKEHFSLVTNGPLDREKDIGYNITQAQPNTDWRFSQTQRPGTSGSQNGEEGGAWPNNQFDTEVLQAMILASANEAADGNSTLGGGTGTMGLSARYGPQFTLQHVPDYRQNVYIPGSTATLTNAAGKRDAKSASSSGGNKKKSGKKEKK